MITKQNLPQSSQGIAPQIEQKRDDQQIDFERLISDPESFVSKAIEYTAKKLSRCSGFSLSDREDLQQELAFRLLRSTPKYDSKRGQYSTFIKHVINNKIASMIRYDKAFKRKSRKNNTSIYTPIKDEDSGDCELHQTLNETTLKSHTGRSPRAENELNQLYRDVRDVMSELSPQQRKLANQLTSDSITQIAQSEGVSRSRIYAMKDKLRKRFEDAGLRAYL